MNKNERGFTLIELVVVIIILGILAAIAAPRFVNLQGSARVAALNGLRASVSSAATLANALQVASNLTSGAAVTMDGQTVNMTGGYPDSTANGIFKAINIDASTFTTAAGATFNITGFSTCSFTYATSVNGAFPVVSAAPASTACN